MLNSSARAARRRLTVNEDLGVAAVVGRFFLVGNAVQKDPSIEAVLPANVVVTEGRNGEGFYEAVVRSLAEARG